MALTVNEYTVPEVNASIVVDNCDVTISEGTLAVSSSELVVMT